MEGTTKLNKLPLVLYLLLLKNVDLGTVEQAHGKHYKHDSTSIALLYPLP